MHLERIALTLQTVDAESLAQILQWGVAVRMLGVTLLIVNHVDHKALKIGNIAQNHQTAAVRVETSMVANVEDTIERMIGAIPLTVGLNATK